MRALLRADQGVPDRPRLELAGLAARPRAGRLHRVVFRGDLELLAMDPGGVKGCTAGAASAARSLLVGDDDCSRDLRTGWHGLRLLSHRRATKTREAERLRGSLDGCRHFVAPKGAFNPYERTLAMNELDPSHSAASHVVLLRPQSRSPSSPLSERVEETVASSVEGEVEQKPQQESLRAPTKLRSFLPSRPSTWIKSCTWSWSRPCEPCLPTRCSSAYAIRKDHVD
jgi:hypothetical protein